MNRRPYPSDVSDEEWGFVAPYLSLLPQTAAQRRHELREVFNALRWMVRSGAPWRHAARPLPALGGGLSTDPPLDRRRLLSKPLSMTCACSCAPRLVARSQPERGNH